MLYDQEFEVDVNGEPMLLHCFFEIEPLVKGVYNRDPYECYPDEGGYAQLNYATFNDDEIDIKRITQSEVDRICELAYEDAMDSEMDRWLQSKFEY